jgi:polyprenyldihydroxybenzoate methyltransferase/3-demethylubiquinol 3-O-methyltransferase
MNPLRVEFVKNGLKNTGYLEVNSSSPLEGVKILDVGCGGGILSEPLARIGAQVTGLDASKELIAIANEHKQLDTSLASNLTYVNNSVEDFAQENQEEYDVVVASEILEHVIDQSLFLKV